MSEFAYVTDGACTENEILDEELLMLKVTCAFDKEITNISDGCFSWHSNIKVTG